MIGAHESEYEYGVTRTPRGIMRRQHRHRETPYLGPFRCRIWSEESSGTHGNVIKVDQGYIYAGLASADFPNTIEVGTPWPMANADEYDVTALPTGDYLLYMKIAVDPYTGLFTSSYYPVLDEDQTSAYNIQNAAYPAVILADFHITNGGGSGVCDHLQQRWHGDIYVPVTNNSGTYVCSWGIP